MKEEAQIPCTNKHEHVFILTIFSSQQNVQIIIQYLYKLLFISYVYNYFYKDNFYRYTNILCGKYKINKYGTCSSTCCQQ